jgi:NAD-dependent dihydropyrimidine dehydrogenase PreA subunit
MVVKEWKSDDWTIKIDYDKCVGAGECVDICPAEVYVLVEGKSTAPNIDAAHVSRSALRRLLNTVHVEGNPSIQFFIILKPVGASPA